jgi:hypothetical protein
LARCKQGVKAQANNGFQKTERFCTTVKSAVEDQREWRTYHRLGVISRGNGGRQGLSSLGYHVFKGRNIGMSLRGKRSDNHTFDVGLAAETDALAHLFHFRVCVYKITGPAPDEYV